MQDERSRVVIAFNDTSIEFPEMLEQQGILKIPIHASLRVRIIIEDIDLFHKDGAESQSYFSFFMIEEFHHPLIVK